MPQRWRKSWWFLLVLGLLAAGLSAGSVVAARIGGPDRQTFLSPARDGALVRVGDLSAENGLPARGVFVQRTSNRLLCLWDAPNATSPARQGGCNSADDPLAGQRLIVSFAYEGGPATEDVTDARLIGLGAPEVAGIQVLMSDETRRDVHLKKASIGGESFQAFGIRMKKADLRRGIGPTAVIALDESGAEIDRQTTGFQG